MLRLPTVTLFAVLSLGFAGCGAEEPEAPEPAPAEEPAVEVPAEPAELTPDEMPLAEDFNEEAAAAVDEADLEAQVDAIEREIAVGEAEETGD